MVHNSGADQPDKIILLFAQRTEDELVKSKAFMAMENVTLIPQDHLGRLADSEVQELARLRATRVGQPGKLLCDAVERYDGHPYAIQAALDIVKKTKSIELLPQDPTAEAIAQTQWEQVCDLGADAISLFEAYAILEVGVPDDVVQSVSGLDATARKHLQKDGYLRGLLREEGYCKRIYHAILADYIVAQIGDSEKRQYHSRAAAVYRERLKDARERKTPPDALATTRLADHVLAAEGDKAFVSAFINECYKSLTTLGLLDNAIDLSERALGYVVKGSGQHAAILGNLGLIYRTRGDLDMAEQMFRKAMEITGKIGCSVGMANQYGNLGMIYQKRGNLDQAEQMFGKSLEINEDLGRLEGMANQYDSLGLIYRIRNDLSKAEQMHKKSLEINEKIGSQDGMAGNYGNLGVLHLMRGDLEKAEPMFKKALEINEKIGRAEGMANQYGNLGLVYLDRGDLSKAEQMLEMSMEINETLRRLGGMATDCANLGAIYRKRCDLERAREYWKKGLEIFKRIGMKPETEMVQEWLDELQKGGDS